MTRTNTTSDQSVSVLSRRRFLQFSLVTGAAVASTKVLGAGHVATPAESMGRVELTAVETRKKVAATTTVTTKETAVPLGRASVFVGNPHTLKTTDTFEATATADEPFVLSLLELVDGKRAGAISTKTATKTAGVYRATLTLTKSTKRVTVQVTNGLAAMQALSVTSTTSS